MSKLLSLGLGMAIAGCAETIPPVSQNPGAIGTTPEIKMEENCIIAGSQVPTSVVKERAQWQADATKRKIELRDLIFAELLKTDDPKTLAKNKDLIKAQQSKLNSCKVEAEKGVKILLPTCSSEDQIKLIREKLLGHCLAAELDNLPSNSIPTPDTWSRH